MDEASIVAAAAEKMGMPESMVRRSAAARAKAQGVDADAVLMEWAGVDASMAAPAATPASAPAATSAPAPAEPTPAAAAPAEQAPVAVVEPEVLGSPDEVALPSTPEPPDPFESEEEAMAGGALPRWLAALFVLVPVFAIGYALFLPNGPNCGDAGSLAIDPVTGLAVNCDGSEFGVEFVDLFSLGAEIYRGAGCTACHGPNGGGIATFPAFTEGALLSTFPQDSCSTQVEWIALGTTGWPESTYGANEKPVGGSGAVMPGFESSLSSEEMAAVALYERVAFGGQELDAALLDCGGELEAGAAALGE
jgi:mono/diheme cytochrome c family protein